MFCIAFYSHLESQNQKMSRIKKRRQKKQADKVAKILRPAKVSLLPPDEREQTLTFQQALDLALQHYQAGELPKIDSIYKQIMQADPNEHIALHLLGLLLIRSAK
jgi:hypothetical protein